MKKTKKQRAALAKRLERYEDEVQRVVCASGVEGMKVIFSSFSAGNHIVVVGNLHDGVRRLLMRIMHMYNLDINFVNSHHVADIEEALTNKTVAIYMDMKELEMSEELEQISHLTKTHNIMLIVDNTSSRPYIKHPHIVGADIIFHSGMKYVAGYSDVVAGLIIMEANTAWWLQKEKEITYNPQI